MAEKETRCGSCKKYLQLPEPFHYEKDGYPDGITVHGFCTKDTTKNFSFYPVYLPDGGACKAFVAKPRQGKKPTCPCDGQLSMEV